MKSRHHGGVTSRTVVGRRLRIRELVNPLVNRGFLARC
jgi:hypothetical protein